MKKEKINEILKRLRKHYPKAKIALTSKTHMQLLVSVILSAQCTDKRVNIVTKTLFKKYKTPKDFAKANLKTFEQEIRSTGFYKNKAKSIINSGKMIVKDFNRKVPGKMEDLLKLPGVARKTANVILHEAFNINEGIVVDTHVSRISQRLGFTEEKTPVKIEQDLMKVIPKKDWRFFSFEIINHGRNLCKAPTPICSECFLKDICPKIGVKKYK